MANPALATLPHIAELTTPEKGIAGIGYRLLISAEQTGGAYELMYFEVPPGRGTPLHVHRHEDECVYTLEGDMEGIVGGKPVRTPAGTCIHLPRNVPHLCRNVGSGMAKFLIWVTPGQLGSFYEECLCPWGSEMASVTLPSEAETAGFMAAAARYGIEILPS